MPQEPARLRPDVRLTIDAAAALTAAIRLLSQAHFLATDAPTRQGLARASTQVNVTADLLRDLLTQIKPVERAYMAGRDQPS